MQPIFNGAKLVEFPLEKYSGVPIHPEADTPFDKISCPNPFYKIISEPDIALETINNPRLIWIRCNLPY